MRDHRHIITVLGGGLAAVALAASLAGCGSSGGAPSVPETTDTTTNESTTDDATTSSEGTDDGAASSADAASDGVVDTTDLFTERDLAQTADTSDATTLSLVSGEDVQISEEGVYVISGEATDVTITVEADKTEKVQLVLDGVSITNTDFPAIYVKSADKVFVTTAERTTNVLTVSGNFVDDGETDTDAVIFSRDDLVLNGLGTLEVNSTDNGIASKDDLKVTGGTYVITVADDALEANDAICVAGGELSVTSDQDGLHADGDDSDDTVGYIYLGGGTLDVTAGDEGICATTYLQIDGGSVTVSANEALEATYVQINGGTVDLTASDDGINASYESSGIGTPTIEIRGGTITVSVGAGDTDALDSNGDIVMSGGQLDISAQSAFDFNGTASFTGGTITVNGEQVSEITNSRGGGGMVDFDYDDYDDDDGE